MDLSAIYSKTPKGLRARASLIGGLSSHLMKVLTHVDGSSKAETILLKFDKLTPQQLGADLARLEKEGYIRLATVTSATDDSWALTINFEPMVVEEYQSEEELEALAQAQAMEQARQKEREQVEQQAKQEEERRLAAQEKADKKAQKLREKEKNKAETKVKAQLEQERLAQQAQEKQRQEIERMAREAAKKEAEAEAQLKAKQEAERVEQQKQAAERSAKLAEEMRLKAELKAREVAEKAEAEAEASAKENAKREIERISREAEEAQRKSDSEAKAKQENERLEALKLAQAAEEARQAELKAQAEHEAQAQAAAEQARAEDEAAAAKAAELERLKQAEKAAQEEALKEKLAQEEKARLEIANVLRKAEEDRKNAVAQVKAEKLEAKRQAKADQEARAQAERKAKEAAKELARQQKLQAQAEEQAKAEAEHQAQTEAARIAKEAEAKQVADAIAVQAENKQAQPSTKDYEVQTAAKAVLAHLLADEQANIAAKQNARLEMERIGREADQVRQKATQQQKVSESPITLPQQQPVAEPYFPEIENSEAYKLQQDPEDYDDAEAAEAAAFEAEERVAEAEIVQITRQANVDINSVDIKNAAKAEAEAMASVRGKMPPFVSVKKIKKWAKMFAKVSLIYVPLLILMALVLINFINLSGLVKPIEQIASQSMGVPVNIKKVHASIWPQPHLVLEDVTVGTENRIEAIHVQPDTATLFEKVKVVQSLVIEGLTIEQANFDQPLQWVNNISKAENLKVEQINLKNITLAIRDLQLESFDGKVTLTDAGALNAIELVSSNNALSVTISPQGSDNIIVLKATNWLLPFNQKIMFSALNAKGLASQTGVNFSQIEGEVFGGNLTGQANVEWPSGASPWQSSGAFKLSNANTEAVLNSFDSAIAVEGKLAMDGKFSGNAREASKLASNTITDANFDVRQGSIKGIQLTRGVLSPGKQSLAGDSTQFDKLTGNAKFNQNQYQFGKLVLASPQFNANGFINISANQMLTGRVNADLATQSRRLKANFGITGRGEDLKSD